jgi:hypothetical protein
MVWSPAVDRPARGGPRFALRESDGRTKRSDCTRRLMAGRVLDKLIDQGDLPSQATSPGPWPIAERSVLQHHFGCRACCLPISPASPRRRVVDAIGLSPEARAALSERDERAIAMAVLAGWSGITSPWGRRGAAILPEDGKTLTPPATADAARVSRETLAEPPKVTRLYRSGRRHRNAAATRQAMIDAVLTLVGQGNFRPEGRDVARFVGCEASLVSYYFGSLDGLLQVIAEEHAPAILTAARVEASMADGPHRASSPG